MTNARYRITAIIICWAMAALALSILMTDQFRITDRVPESESVMAHRAEMARHSTPAEHEENRTIQDRKKAPGIQRGLRRLKQHLGIEESNGGQ